MRVTLDFPAAEEILQEVGLDEQGDTQMFHTKKNKAAAHSKVYALPYRRDHQADRRPDRPRVPEIVTEEPGRRFICITA